MQIMALTLEAVGSTRRVAKIGCSLCHGVLIVSVTTPARLRGLVEAMEADHVCIQMREAV